MVHICTQGFDFYNYCYNEFNYYKYRKYVGCCVGCWLISLEIYKNLKKQNNTNKEPRDEYLLVET